MEKVLRFNHHVILSLYLCSGGFKILHRIILRCWDKCLVERWFFKWLHYSNPYVWNKPFISCILGSWKDGNCKFHTINDVVQAARQTWLTTWGCLCLRVCMDKMEMLPQPSLLTSVNRESWTNGILGRMLYNLMTPSGTWWPPRPIHEIAY